jgi:hypothetical protein
MKEVLNIISSVLYFLVAVISLLMAYKSMSAKKYMPFHEQAAGTSWESIDKPLQYVIITILRISGLGFLVVFLLMAILSFMNYFKPNPIIKVSVPVIAFIFCSGLFLFNFILYRKTRADTPWKGSLIAMFIILICFIISVI